MYICGRGLSVFPIRPRIGLCAKRIRPLAITMLPDGRNRLCRSHGKCSAAGRCNALIETDDAIYLFEFKLDGTAEEALKQIDAKGYAIQYEAGDKRIVKVGVNFDKEKRTIERWCFAE